MTQEPATTAPALIKVEDLKVYFPIIGGGILQRTSGHVRAVDQVSFEIYEGETLGLVGESGCGKTTVGRALMGAVEATGGSIKFTTRDDDELDLLNTTREGWSIARQQMQLVFQDPFSSLNPRMTIYDIVGDPLRVNKLASARNAKSASRKWCAGWDFLLRSSGDTPMRLAGVNGSASALLAPSL